MTAGPTLSVVIPAYNEEQRIDRTLRGAVDYLARRHPRFELLVVDDGSTDETRAIVARYTSEDSRVALIALPTNRGKGAAVRRGMLAARGDHVLFMDADLATPMHELEKLLAVASRGVEVVFGSRGMAESQVRRSQGRVRQGMGQTFNRILQLVLLSGVSDTQCGFKLFSRRAAREIFSRVTVDHFAFDVEALLLARELGLSMQEVAIEWFHDPQSRVSLLGDSTRMLLDVARLRLRVRRRVRL